MLRELDSRRLDLVDNTIINTIQMLRPRGKTSPEYDDDMAHLVGEIAQLIEDYYVDHKLCTDKEFRDYYTEEEIAAEEAEDKGEV